MKTERETRSWIRMAAGPDSLLKTKDRINFTISADRALLITPGK